MLYHNLFTIFYKGNYPSIFQPPKFISKSYLHSAYKGLSHIFKYGVVYDDAMFNDSRLNIDLILKA